MHARHSDCVGDYVQFVSQKKYRDAPATIDRRKKDRGASAMASNSIGPERHHLARQVQAFRGHAKRLKKIFKDTVKVLSDLQDFDESLSIDQILAVEAQKCISNVVSGRTAMVVFGDTRLRASIVNEILGKCVCVCACVGIINKGWQRRRHSATVDVGCLGVVLRKAFPWWTTHTRF